MNAAVLKVRNVQKSFKKYSGNQYSLKAALLGRGQRIHEEFRVLSDVSLSLNGGEVLGIVGGNGSGKSTLLKIISGIIPPDRGEVKVVGQLSAILELGAGFHPEYSGYENIALNGALLGMSERYLKSKIPDIIAFSELEDFIYTPVKNYSSGMYMRLAFSIAIHVNPTLLILDEVLSVGDEAFQQKCLRRIVEMASSGTTVLFVSHSSGLVKSLCTRVVVLNDGRVAFDGNPDDGLTYYHEEMSKPQTRR